MNRSAALLLAIVFALFVEWALRYRKRDVTGDGKDETFCNFFVRDACDALGVPLPRPMRANELIQWFVTAPGWELVDEHTAQAMAEQGQVVVACWFNHNGGPGHLALVVPSLGEPGTWVAQAGAVNFSRGPLASAFPGLPVTFFAHP